MTIKNSNVCILYIKSVCVGEYVKTVRQWVLIRFVFCLYHLYVRLYDYLFIIQIYTSSTLKALQVLGCGYQILRYARITFASIENTILHQRIISIELN